MSDEECEEVSWKIDFNMVLSPLRAKTNWLKIIYTGRVAYITIYARV